MQVHLNIDYRYVLRYVSTAHWTGELAHRFATLAVGGLAGVATQTTSLSANVCPFGRLLEEQEGWQSGAERPKKVLRSIFSLSTDDL